MDESEFYPPAGFPSLKDYAPSAPPRPFTESSLKQKLSELRLKDFENDLQWLCEKIIHYKKLHDRWKRFDSGVRYTDIVLGSVIGIGGAVILSLSSMGIGTSIILVSSVTAIPIINTVMHGILNISVFKSRITKYDKLIRELEDSKNKLFLFHQKALKDEVLTDEEINISKSMINEIKEKILGNKVIETKSHGGGVDSTTRGEILKQLDELRKKIT